MMAKTPKFRTLPAINEDQGDAGRRLDADHWSCARGRWRLSGSIRGVDGPRRPSP